MLTAVENLKETLKVSGKPDRLVNDYEAFGIVDKDPIYVLTRGNRVKGKTTKDAWGVTIAWPEEQLYAFPTEQDKVCPDITEWKDTVKIPDLAGKCSDPALWKDPLPKRSSSAKRASWSPPTWAPVFLSSPTI